MKRIIIISLTLLFINPALSQPCIEDVRALVDEFIEVQGVEIITSDGKGYVGYDNGGQVLYSFSALTGLKTIQNTVLGFPIGVSANGQYVVVRGSNEEWYRWEISSGTLLHMPFPQNTHASDNPIRVAADGSVFANLHNPYKGYYWTPSEGWTDLGSNVVLAGVSNNGDVRVGITGTIWKETIGEWETMGGFDIGTVRVNDLSGNGEYATGYFKDLEDNYYAFRWANDNVDLMPGSIEGSEDEGKQVNDNGSILAIVSRPPNFGSSLIWWSGNNATNLYDVLIQTGLHPNLIPVIFDGLLPDGSNGSVSLISDDGLAMAGSEIFIKRIVRSGGSCAAGISGTLFQYSVQGGNPLAVQWYPSGISGDVTLEWSPDGISYTFIDNAPAMQLTGENAGIGYYTWSVPFVNADSAYIRITAPGAEEILGPFSISSPLIFMSPSSDDLLIAGETDTIKWEGVDSVNIYLSIDYENGSGVFNPIAENYFSDSGKYVWQIPDTILSRKCVVMIEDAGDPAISAESGVFRIKPYVLTRVNPDSNYYDFQKNRDQWGFENTESDMWPIPWWLQFNYNGVDPFTGSQYSRWQADSAFVNANMAHHPDWISWVNTFTTDACYYSTLLGIYKADAVLKWKAWREPWGGSCFGIAIGNALAFQDKNALRTKYPEFPEFNNPINVASNDGVKKVINELYTHQRGNPHLNYRGTIGLNKTPKQTLIELMEMFKEDNTLVRTLSFNNNGPGGGGHAVLAYGLEKDIANQNIFYLKIYDNSYPNSNNRIIIDTSANGGTGSWNTPDWPGWGGSRKFYLRNPASEYLNNPVVSKAGNYNSPFILDDTLLQVFNPVTASVKITDSFGNVTGFINSNILQDIPNSIPIVADNGSETPPYGYSLTADNYSVALNQFTGDTLEVFFFSGNKSFSYERINTEQTETDKLFYDGGLSASNPDAQTKSVKILNLINEESQEKLTVIKSLELAQNDSVKIENPDSSKIKLISFGSAKEYDIELNYVTKNGVGRFGDFNIQLTENTSHTFIPDWTDLSGKELQVLVDTGNDGTIDDTLSLKNEVTGINDEGSLLTPDNYNLAQNYPNPFNPVTTIRYSIPENSNVLLKVYDILGNEIAVLVNEEKQAGVYEIIFNGVGLSSGVYFYKLTAGNFSDTKKLILLK